MQYQIWRDDAKRHWKEFRPTMYARLVQSGKLEKAITKAVNQTEKEMGLYLDNGMDYHQAWELVREKYIFLPEEEDADEYDEDDEDDCDEEEEEEMPIAETFRLMKETQALLNRIRDED